MKITKTNLSSLRIILTRLTSHITPSPPIAHDNAAYCIQHKTVQYIRAYRPRYEQRNFLSWSEVVRSYDHTRKHSTPSTASVTVAHTVPRVSSAPLAPSRGKIRRQKNRLSPSFGRWSIQKTPFYKWRECENPLDIPRKTCYNRAREEMII